MLDFTSIISETNSSLNGWGHSLGCPHLNCRLTSSMLTSSQCGVFSAKFDTNFETVDLVNFSRSLTQTLQLQQLQLDCRLLIVQLYEV